MSTALPDDPFRPTWSRAILTGVVAIIGFLLPQEVPLEYFPLNNPSSGLQYIEITCKAVNRGDVQIFLNTGKGISEFESIRWPIDKSDMAYTYTFPLPDAPLLNLRLDPVTGGAGELTITNFRIINRREQEIHRFVQSDLVSPRQIEAIVPLAQGWKIVTAASASDPQVRVDFKHPIIAEGMNERNLKRCLLSWSYLACMLWILVLAVYFTFWQRRDLRTFTRTVGFLAFVCLAFSGVGNRGLIKNSMRSAWFAAHVKTVP